MVLPQAMAALVNSSSLAYTLEPWPGVLPNPPKYPVTILLLLALSRLTWYFYLENTMLDMKTQKYEHSIYLPEVSHPTKVYIPYITAQK